MKSNTKEGSRNEEKVKIQKEKNEFKRQIIMIKMEKDGYQVDK